MGSTSKSTVPTDILDLNDDCLFEVFQYMNALDLCAIADVCSRFRQNAKASFAHFISKHIDFWEGFYHHDMVRPQMLITSQLQRNFGEFIEKIRQTSVYNRGASPKLRMAYQTMALEHLSVHCNASLVDLELVDFELTEKITPKMRPVLKRLKKLTFHQCKFSGLFLKMLPLWCRELEELKFDCIMPHKGVHIFAGLHQTFRKLTKISFGYVDELQCNDINEILKFNPQMKGIELLFDRHLDYRIFESIADLVPGVEQICIRLKKYASKFRTKPIGRVITKYFGKLRNLKSFEIDYRLGPSDIIVSAIGHLADARAPLERLCLRALTLHRSAHRLVEEVSKLKMIETLQISSTSGLNASRITCICGQLIRLNKLILEVDFLPTAENILEWTRTGAKLQLLSLVPLVYFAESHKTVINVDTFTELTGIVRQRVIAAHLKIELSTHSYKSSVPDDLAKRHQDLLTLDVLDNSSYYD